MLINADISLVSMFTRAYTVTRRHMCVCVYVCVYVCVCMCVCVCSMPESYVVDVVKAE